MDEIDTCIKLINSPVVTNKFHKVFPRAWPVIGSKGYFIHQDFLTLGSPEASLKLIKIRQTSSASEPSEPLYLFAKSWIDGPVGGSQFLAGKMQQLTILGYIPLFERQRILLVGAKITWLDKISSTTVRH